MRRFWWDGQDVRRVTQEWTLVGKLVLVLLLTSVSLVIQTRSGVTFKKAEMLRQTVTRAAALWKWPVFKL